MARFQSDWQFLVKHDNFWRAWEDCIYGDRHFFCSVFENHLLFFNDKLLEYIIHDSVWLNLNVCAEEFLAIRARFESVNIFSLHTFKNSILFGYNMLLGVIRINREEIFVSSLKIREFFL